MFTFLLQIKRAKYCLDQLRFTGEENNTSCSSQRLKKLVHHIIQIYSGITSGRVLDGELLYTEILEVNLFAFALTCRISVKLIYLHLFTDCLMKVSLQSSEHKL